MNSSTEAPRWWSSEIARACTEFATEGLPNEICGLFIQSPSGVVSPVVLPALATPSTVQAHPESVIRLAYQALSDGHEIIGTFHSHPLGVASFSKRDEALAAWGQWHALAVWAAGSWKWFFAVRANGSTLLKKCTN